MSVAICLDGVRLYVDADDVEVDFHVRGLAEKSLETCTPWIREEGEALEPVAHYEDGTTIYYRSPAEGTEEAAEVGSYTVESSRSHHWDMSISNQRRDGAIARVARFDLHLD